jgi:2'-5' RNA ligase
MHQPLPETRPYHPHITLARSKAKGSARIRDMQALQAGLRRVQKFTAFVAEEFVLYESVPAAGGSLYKVREHFSLG